MHYNNTTNSLKSKKRKADKHKGKSILYTHTNACNRNINQNKLKMCVYLKERNRQCVSINVCVQK